MIAFLLIFPYQMVNLHRLSCIFSKFEDSDIHETSGTFPKLLEKSSLDRSQIMEMEHVGKGVNRSEECPGMEGLQYLWLYSKKNLPESQRGRFEAFHSLNMKVGRAWAMKEKLRALWHASSLKESKSFWKRWFWWTTHSRLKPKWESAYLIK